MNTQKEKAVRDLDASIYKIMDSYRMLLRKSQVNTAGTMNVHEELQVETASASIVHYSQAILDQIHDLRMQLLFQESNKNIADNDYMQICSK